MPTFYGTLQKQYEETLQKNVSLRAQLAEVESKLEYQRKCTQVNWDKMEAVERERDDFKRIAGEQAIASLERDGELEALREAWEPVAKILMDGNAAHYYDCLPGQRGGPPGEDCSRLCIDLRAFIAAFAAAPAEEEET